MGILHGNQGIVRDNLTLYYDAGNKYSYIGSGTVLNDLSGNMDTGTLENGATYNSGNGGYIVFDGTNDHISTMNLPSTRFDTGEFTVALWAFTSNLDDERGLISSGNSNWETSGTWQISLKSNKLKFIIRNDAGGAQFNISSSTSPTIDTWYYFVGTRSTGGNCKLYFNGGELEASGTDLNSGSDIDVQKLKIGINRALNTEWQGGIAMTQVYKGKALSATEILRNYNVHKERFGL
mgnify:CR=1 FL=1|tara:strand:+ start:1160 stop:1867 length:708 start_codon:yes stop_codon:yes gene_type:complete